MAQDKKIDLLQNAFTGQSINPANNQSSTKKSGSSSSSKKKPESKAKAPEVPKKNGVTDWGKIGEDAAKARQQSAKKPASKSNSEKRIAPLQGARSVTSQTALPNLFEARQQQSNPTGSGTSRFENRFTPAETARRISPIAGFNSQMDIFGRQREDNGRVIKRLGQMRSVNNLDEISDSNVVSSFIKHGKDLSKFINNSLKSPFASSQDTDTATYVARGYELAKGYLEAFDFQISKQSDGTQQRDVISYTDRSDVASGGIFAAKREEVLRGSVHYNRLLVNLMNEDEQTAYLYILGRYGQDKADEYIRQNGRDALDRKFVQEIRVKAGKNFAEEDVKSYLGSNLDRVLYGPASALQGAVNIFRDEPDTYYSDVKIGFRQAEYDIIDSSVSNPFLNFAIKRLEDAKNMALDFAWTGPLILLAGAFGAVSSAASATVEWLPQAVKYGKVGLNVLERAAKTAQFANDVQAGQISKGIDINGRTKASAISQGFIQSIAFDKVMSPLGLSQYFPGASGVKKFVIDISGKILYGAGENAAQEVLGNIADIVIAGEYSNYNTLKEQLEKAGYTENEAAETAAKEVFVNGTVDAAVIGGLMSGVSGIAGTVEDVISYRDYGKQLKANGIDAVAEGLNLNKNSAAYKNAVKLERKNKITDSMIGAQGILNEIEYNNQRYFMRTVMDDTGIHIVPMGRSDKYDGRYDRGFIFLADDPELAHDLVIKHELFHAAKDRKPEAADEFIEILKNKQGWAAAVEKTRKAYERQGKDFNENLLYEEVAADFSMNLFRKSKDLNAAYRRIKNDPVMFDGIRRRIESLKNKVSKHNGRAYRNDVTGIRVTMKDFDTLESLFSEALFGGRNEAKADGGRIDRYTYDALTAKSNMPLTPLGGAVPRKENGQLDRAAVIDAGIENVRSKNNAKNDDTNSYVHNNDTGRDILVGRDCLRHGLNRNTDAAAYAVSHIGDIIKNAIAVNELKPRGNTEGGYVLMGIGTDADGNYYPIRIIVNKYNHIETLEPFDVLYAVRAAKKDRSEGHYNPAGSTENGSPWHGLSEKNRSESHYNPAEFTAEGVSSMHGLSDISIADFLDIVKRNYPDVLSQDVLDTYGIQRPHTSLSDSVRYRLKLNADKAVYGVSVENTLFNYTRDMAMDRSWRDYIRYQAQDRVREAYEAYNRGDDSAGRNLLLEAGQMVADHAPRKTNESRDIAGEFAEHMYNVFDQAKTRKIIEGQDVQGLADKAEFNFSARSLLYGMRLNLNVDRSDDTTEIENSMREGFRLMKSGASADEINSFLRPAAESLLDHARNDDGTRLYNDGYSEAKDRAAAELTARMKEYYKNSQLANAETDSAVITDDYARYYRDIETPIRSIGVKGMTEGEVKQLGQLVRDSVDKLVSGSVDVGDLRKEINKEISAVMYGKDRGALDYSLITATVTDNVLGAANEIISRDIARNRDIIEVEAAEGRETSEVAQRARAQLGDARNKADRLNGFSDIISNPFKMSKLFENTLQNPFNAVNAEELNNRIDEFCYQTETNRDQYNRAVRELEDNGFERSITELKNKQAYEGSDTIKAMILINHLGRMGLERDSVDLSVILSHRLRQYGRAVQAAAVAKLLTPEGRIIKFEQDYGMMINKRIEDMFKNADDAKNTLEGLERARDIDNERRADADEKLTANFEEHRQAKEAIEQGRQELFEISNDIADARNEAAEADSRTKQLERHLDAIEHRNKAQELRNETAAQKEAERAEADARNKAQQKALGNAVREAENRMNARDLKLKRMRNGLLSDDEIKHVIETCGGSLNDVDHELIGMLVDRINTDGRIDDIAAVVYDYNNKKSEPAYDAADDESLTESRFEELTDELLRLDDEVRGLVDEIHDKNKRMDELAQELETRNETLQGAIDGLISYIQRGYDDVFGMRYEEIVNGGVNVYDYVSAVDTYLDDLDIPHVTTAEMKRFKRELYKIISYDSVDELIQGILRISDERGTAKQFGDKIKPLKGADGKQKYKQGSLYDRLKKFYYDYDPGITGEDGNLKVNKELADKKLDVLRDLLVQQAFGAITDRMNNSVPRKWRTMHFAMQLMSFGTFGRNILSEVVMGELEKGVTNAAAVLTLPGRLSKDPRYHVPFEMPFKGKSGKIEAASRRANEAYLETAFGVDIIGRDRSALGKFKPSRRSITALSKPGRYIGAPLERLMGYSLSVTDEWLKGYYKESVKESYKNSGLSDDEIERIAADEADYRVFQNDTLPGTLLENIRRALNTVGFGEKDEHGIHEFGLGDFVTTYTLIPGAIFTRTLEYSPLGFLKALYNIGEMYHNADAKTKARIAQYNLDHPSDTPVKLTRFERLGMNGADISHYDFRRAMLALTRPMLGTVGIMTAYKLAQMGIIVGHRSDDYDEEQYEKSKNLDTYKLNLSQLGRLIRNEDNAEKAQDKDVLMPIAWATPIHSLMGIGSELFHKLGDYVDTSLIEIAGTTLSSSADVSVEAMKDLAMWSSINGAVQNYKKTNGWGEFALAEAADFSFSFMPSLLRQAANAHDDYQRDPYKTDGLFSLFWNKIKSNTPWLRETLPKKIDPFGQAVNTSLGSKVKDFANQMLSPSRLSLYQKNALTEELDRLSRINPDILPSDPYREHEGEKNGKPWRFKLNGHDFEEYKNMQNSMAYEAMFEFITSEDYKLLSDRDKMKWLEEIQKDCRYAAEDMWVGRQTAAGDRYILSFRDKVIEEYKHKAADITTKYQADEYLMQDGVKVEDVINVSYYEPLSEIEKEQELNRAEDGIKEFSEKLYNVTSGTWYSYDPKKRADKREYYERELRYFTTLKESIENGTHKGKFHAVTGAFAELSADDKERVLTKMDKYPEEIKLPDGLPKRDMSADKTEVVDLTKPVVNGLELDKPIKTAAVDLDFRTENYPRSSADDKKKDGGNISVWKIVKNFKADKTVSLDKDEPKKYSSGGRRRRRYYKKRRKYKRYRRGRNFQYKGYKRGRTYYSRSYRKQNNYRKQYNNRILPLKALSRFGNRFDTGGSRFGNRFKIDSSRFGNRFVPDETRRIQKLKGGENYKKKE